jgi:hypothetical protein
MKRFLAKSAKYAKGKIQIRNGCWSEPYSLIPFATLLALGALGEKLLLLASPCDCEANAS